VRTPADIEREANSSNRRGTPLPLLIRLLGWSARHGTALLAASILAGIACAPLAAALRPAVAPAVALLMTLVLLRIDPAQVIAWLRRPLLVLGLSAWVLVACPLVAFVATRAMGLNGPLGGGLVLGAAACAAVSAPAFARLVGLDAEISLVVSVVTTALLPFTAPPLALGLLGLDLAITIPGLMLRLLLIVGIPALLAWGLRAVLGPARLARAAAGLDGGVVLILVVFAFGVMDGVQARLLADPLWVLGGVALAMAGNLGLNALTAAVIWPLGRTLALSAGMLAGNRNQALFLAVLPAAADPGVLLFFALGQVPMFLSPFLLRPIYARLRQS
jgi:bile acid:Na+ symporter, BASS family